MHATASPDDWFRHVSATVWWATSKQRSQLNHGIRRCPQRVDPLAISGSEIECQQCAELHTQTLMVARKKLKDAAAEQLDDALRARSFRLAGRWTLEARDQLVGALGMTVRPVRLPAAKWFRTAVPDPLTQKLVIDTVYFVRSGDDAGASELPFERFAARVGLTVDEARLRLLHAIAALRAVKPEWVDANIDQPLSRRMSANTCDSSADFVDPADDFDEDDDDLYPWADEA